MPQTEQKTPIEGDYFSPYLPAFATAFQTQELREKDRQADKKGHFALRGSKPSVMSQAGDTRPTPDADGRRGQEGGRRGPGARGSIRNTTRSSREKRPSPTAGGILGFSHRGHGLATVCKVLREGKAFLKKK